MCIHLRFPNINYKFQPDPITGTFIVGKYTQLKKYLKKTMIFLILTMYITVV